eukprot:3794057-Rhodomonas_salina.1
MRASSPPPPPPTPQRLRSCGFRPLPLREKEGGRLCALSQPAATRGKSAPRCPTRAVEQSAQFRAGSEAAQRVCAL